MNTYTVMTIRSKQVAALVKNLSTLLITIHKGIKVNQVVAGNAVPQVEVVLETLEKLDEMQSIL